MVVAFFAGVLSEGDVRGLHSYGLDAKGWQAARQQPLEDFEDSVVVAVAMATRSAFIITRNARDFTNSPVPAITPADFLSRLS